MKERNLSSDRVEGMIIISVSARELAYDEYGRLRVSTAEP